MKDRFSPSRRGLLAGGGAALAAAGLSGLALPVGATTRSEPQSELPAFAAWKDAASLRVHGSGVIETRREAFGTSLITPAERLYVRNNLPAPEATILDDRDAWRVDVAGVRSPRALSVAELKRLGLETVATVLQCSGNGRDYFATRPSGTPWQVGAAGCVLWSGVPLRRVVEALGGVRSGLRWLTGTGGEPLPEGLDPRSLVVERSVPVDALADAMLAWEMNGIPLPLAHGGPLRLVLPGYSGINNIKYVRRVAFTAEESDARIMSHGYRLAPPGMGGDPSQPSVQRMTVKSWVNGPGADGRPVAAGDVQIHGVAFGGSRALAGVEVSLDGGLRWRAASIIGPDLGRFAWRQFVLSTRLAPGRYTVASRATDAAGEVQPELRLENAGGYNNTSWADHALELVVG